MPSLTTIHDGFPREHQYVLEPVTQRDVLVATVSFGWTLGFGFFVMWHASQRTIGLNLFVVLIWSEILAVINPSIVFYMGILTCWALQVQLLLQIIINRICLLWPIKHQRLMLKYGVAALITSINISVYCIWVPARLQISFRYEEINIVWDRVEKCIYLLVDLSLNVLFIRTVNKRLLSYGLERYRPLVRFNMQMIAISIACDILIIAMMSYPNTFVYMQFHPVAYLAKLNIEMAMSTLMIEIASAKRERAQDTDSNALAVAVHTQVEVESMTIEGKDVFELSSVRNGRFGLPALTPVRIGLKERLDKIRTERAGAKRKQFRVSIGQPIGGQTYRSSLEDELHQARAEVQKEKEHMRELEDRAAQEEQEEIQNELYFQQLEEQELRSLDDDLIWTSSPVAAAANDL